MLQRANRTESLGKRDLPWPGFSTSLREVLQPRPERCWGAWCVPRCHCSPVTAAGRPKAGWRVPRVGHGSARTACLACLSGQAHRSREHASCLSTGKAATCLPFAELLPGCSGNVRIALRNTVSCFCPPAPPHSLCKLSKL